MTIDLRLYRHGLNTMRAMLVNNKFPLEDFVGNVSIATGAPVIAVCYYIAKLNGGWTPELEKRKNNLMLFYKVDTILGEDEI